MSKLNPRFSVRPLSRTYTVQSYWIDATDSLIEIEKKIEEYFGDIEWCVDDFDDMPNMKGIDSLEEITAIACHVIDYGLPYILWCESNYMYDPSKFEKSYIGHFKNILEFGEYMVDQMDIFHQATELMKRYFDYGKFANDLLIDGFYMIDDFYFRDL